MSASFRHNRHEPYHWPFGSKEVGLGLVWPDIARRADYFPVQFRDQYFAAIGICSKRPKSQSELIPPWHGGGQLDPSVSHYLIDS